MRIATTKASRRADVGLRRVIPPAEPFRALSLPNALPKSSAHLTAGKKRPNTPSWHASGRLAFAMGRGARPRATGAFLQPLRLPTLCSKVGDVMWLRREGHCPGSHASGLGSLLPLRAGHAHDCAHCCCHVELQGRPNRGSGRAVSLAELPRVWIREQERSAGESAGRAATNNRNSRRAGLLEGGGGAIMLCTRAVPSLSMRGCAVRAHKQSADTMEQGEFGA